VLRETAVVLVVAAFAAGCGAGQPPQTDREWIANARGVVEQDHRRLRVEPVSTGSTRRSISIRLVATALTFFLP
jgi:hypothetical protein